MRVLGCWERNHDGFRSEKRHRDSLRIYQLGEYLGWTIRNLTHLLSIDESSGGTDPACFVKESQTY